MWTAWGRAAGRVALCADLREAGSGTDTAGSTGTEADTDFLGVCALPLCPPVCCLSVSASEKKSDCYRYGCVAVHVGGLEG
eukprot:scaffold7684_cov119-Isochrysis_galbana.AAC.6